MFLKWLGFVVFGAGAFAYLVWLLATQSEGTPSVFYFVWVLSVFAFIGLINSALRPTRGLIDLFYYLYLGIFLLPPAVLQISADDYPWMVRHELRHVEHATVIIAITMVCYEVGRALHRRHHPPIFGSASPLVPNPALSAFVLGGALFALACIPAFGFGNLFSGRGVLSEFSREISMSSYIFLTGKNVCLAAMAWGVALAASADKRYDSLAVRTYIFWSAVFAAVLAAILFSPLSSARFVTSAFFLCFLYVCFNKLFQKYKIWFVIAFPVLLFYVFSKLKDLSFPERRERFWENLFTIREDYFYSVDFDTMQVVATTINFVEKHGLLGPIEVFGGMLFFIPRKFWLDKPRSTGIVVFEWMGYDYTNLSMPLYMEFYLAFGITGTILGIILFGWLVGRIENRAHEGALLTERNRVLADVIVAVIGGYTLIMLRGPLGSVAPMVGVPIGAAVIGLLLARRNPPVYTPDAGVFDRPVPAEPPPTPPPGEALPVRPAWQGRFHAATRGVVAGQR